MLWLRLPGLLARAAGRVRRLGPSVPLAVAEERLVRDVSPGAHRAGIREGQTLLKARRLCPAVLILPREQVDARLLSHRLLDILADLSPCVEPVGPDAAYALLAPGEERLGEKLVGRFGRLWPVVGWGPSKLVARVSGEFRLAFPSAPSGCLWPQDPAVGMKLFRLGLPTIGSVAELGEAALRYQFGSRIGTLLHRRAGGWDGETVRPLWPAPRVTYVRRFEEPLQDRAHLGAHLSALVHQAAGELSRQRRWGRSLCLCLQTERGESSRAWRPPWPLQSVEELAGAADRLLAQQPPRAAVVGLILCVEELELPQAESLSLLEGVSAGQKRRLEATRQLLLARYGPQSLMRGSQLPVPLRDQRRSLARGSTPG